MSWPALILALVAAASPLSEDPDFLRAKAQYADLEFEEAMAALKKSAARSYSDQERASLEVWMGLCSAQLRDDLGVRAHFAQAVALDVEVALPGFAPPKVAELLEAARVEARARIAAEQPPDAPKYDPPLEDGDSDGDTAQAPTADDPPAGAPGNDPGASPDDDGANESDDLATPTSDDASVVPWIAAGSLGAGAGVMIVAATALSVGGYLVAGLSTDLNQFQSDAQLFALTAMGLYAGAGVAGIAVVVLGTAAGASAVWALVE